MDAARAIFDRIKKSGYGKLADVHLNYIRLERTYGDLDKCRKAFQQALNFAKDDGIEDVYSAALQFERDLGSLEQFDKMSAKAQTQLGRIQQRAAQRAAAAAAKEAEKPSKANKKDKKDRKDKKDKKDKKQPGNKKRDAHERDDEAVPSSKRQKVAAHSSEPTNQDEGNAAAVTGTTPVNAKGGQDGGAHMEGVQKASAKPKKEEVVIDKSTYSRTAFVLNIEFGTEEDMLREFFLPCGEIEEIRLIKKRDGYAYVQFKSEESVPKAMALDRQSLNGRPVFVKKCVDKEANADAADGHEFKYATALEVRQTQCGVNCFILDSRRVLAPAPKVLGPKHISNPDFVPF